MAKKKMKKTQAVEKVPEEKVLPQNILSFGERVEEDKNIYVLQKVYKEIHRFTKNKTTNESGGMLIGYVLEEFGKTNVVINGFIEAKYCEATPTTLTFTHETWDYVHKEMEKKYPDEKIVGWIHTHPDFGIFLSEYDKFIHENFFNEEYQIAHVVDPIQKIEGFYFWINGKIERCKGFYVYDKTGVKIDIDQEKDKEKDEEKTSEGTGMFSFKNVLIGIMAFVIAILVFSDMSQSAEINRLKQQQQTLMESANQSLMMMQQQIYGLSAQLSAQTEATNQEQDNTATPGDENSDANDTNNEGEGAK